MVFGHTHGNGNPCAFCGEGVACNCCGLVDWHAWIMLRPCEADILGGREE